MEHDPDVPKYSTGDRSSFAYVTTKERWPVILTGVIDDTYRSVNETDGERLEDGKQIIRRLTEMKYELQHNRELTPLTDDGKADFELYNLELEMLSKGSIKWFKKQQATDDGDDAKVEKLTWFNIPWLFGECYFYRRIQMFYAQSKYWTSYDPFWRQKTSTLRSSRRAVVELAAHYHELADRLRASKTQTQPAFDNDDKELLIFREMCQICLWGNATDLSLLTSLSFDQLQQLQGAEARRRSEKNIVANDIDAAYDVLRRARDDNKKKDAERGDGGGSKKLRFSRTVDIVLDNAGFELYVDLVFAAYLLDAGLATDVVLHAKSFPWFVSDALPGDFAALLSALAEPREFFEKASDDEAFAAIREPCSTMADVPPAKKDKKSSDEAGEAGGEGKKATTAAPLSEKEEGDILFLFKNLAGHHAEGRMILRPNLFWTHGGSFWRLKSEATTLFDDLKHGVLSVWKGDLNYRKLVGDAEWDPTTPFQEAIGPLGKGSGINVLALRTCKADVVVGLKPGQDEQLRKAYAAAEGSGDSADVDSLKQRRWAWSGKWAVCQFSNGNAETPGDNDPQVTKINNTVAKDQEWDKQILDDRN